MLSPFCLIWASQVALSKHFLEFMTDMAEMDTNVQDTCVIRSVFSAHSLIHNLSQLLILTFIFQLANQILDTLERTPNGSLTNADIKKALMDSHIRVNENVSEIVVMPTCVRLCSQ